MWNNKLGYAGVAAITTVVQDKMNEDLSLFKKGQLVSFTRAGVIDNDGDLMQNTGAFNRVCTPGDSEDETCYINFPPKGKEEVRINVIRDKIEYRKMIASKLSQGVNFCEFEFETQNGVVA